MQYRISHKTTVSYSQSVRHSRQLLHLTPRNTDSQRVLQWEIKTQPAPSYRQERDDYFGNRCVDLQLAESHRELQIHCQSKVDVAERQDILLDLSPNWEFVSQQLAHASNADAWDAAQYSFPSTWINTADAVELAAALFTPGKPLLRGAMDLTEYIFKNFQYRGGVTDVYTPVADVISKKQGVCQDFAHLAIACLRAKGLAARYVSGYILTHPLPGQIKLVGADASHAWLSVWCPEFGWIDFDPTNNLRPGNEHIQCAWGRDYGDVSPVKGVIHGGGKQQLRVSVDVSPE